MSLLKNIYYVLMLLSVSILLIRWKQLDRRLFFYIGILCCAIVTERMHDLFYPQPVSTYIYHIYRISELLLLSAYYFSMFQRKRNRQIVIAGTIIYVVFFLYQYGYFYSNFFTNKRTEFLLGAILITIYSVVYLIELYQQDQAIELKRYPHFWVVMANLLFFSGSAFFNGYIYYLLINKETGIYMQLSFIPVVLNYALYILYIIGFLCRNTQKISE